VTTLNMRASQVDGSGGTESVPKAWQRVLLVAAIADVVCAVLVQVVLARQFIPPLTIVTLVVAGLATAVRLGRLGRRGPVLLAVAGIVYLLGNAPHSLPELAHPGGGVAFVAALVILVSGLLMLLSLVAILAAFPDAVASRSLAGAGAVAIVGVVVCIVATASSTDEPAKAGDVQVAARNMAFQPKRLDLAAGGAAVHVSNHDPVRHTFTIDGRVSVDIAPGKARRVAVDLGPGTYAYHCTVVGHEAMKGTLTVR
jgi:plastocyanin